MQFPRSIGGFERDIINRYDSRQLEVTVDYDLMEAGREQVAATVYVYPSSAVRVADAGPARVASGKSALCQREFNTRKNEIIDAYPAVQVLTENDVVSRQRGDIVSGKTAMFD
jgi:hypothetical protein